MEAERVNAVKNEMKDAEMLYRAEAAESDHTVICCGFPFNIIHCCFIEL